MNNSSQLSSKYYRAIEMVVTPKATISPLRGKKKIIDRLCNFGVGAYRKNIAILKHKPSSFLKDIKFFVKEILKAREKNEHIKLRTKELNGIATTFMEQQKTIQDALCALNKKIAIYNTANGSLESGMALLTWLALLFLVICADQLNIPITFYTNITYAIPATVINRLVKLNDSYYIAPEDVTRTMGAHRRGIVHQYDYLWNKSNYPNTTTIVKTTHCTSSASSCASLSSAVGSSKIIIFCLLLLLGIAFLIHVRLTKANKDLLTLRDELAILDKKYFQNRYLLHFTEDLRTNSSCRTDDEFSYYESDILYQPQYNHIVDRYME